MRKISLWAKHHRIAAVVLLIICKLLLIPLAFFIGTGFQEIGIYIPASLYIAATAITIAAAFFYPARKKKPVNKQRFYVHQKTCDFLIAMGTFAAMTTLVNTDFAVARPLFSSAAISVIDKPTAEEILASLKYRHKSTLTRKEKRILKQEFKKQLILHAKAKLSGNKKDAEKTLLIILTILGACGLFYIIAGLACNLSCSGSETAAILLLILGTLGILIGAIVLIRRIKRGPKRDHYIPKSD